MPPKDFLERTARGYNSGRQKVGCFFVLSKPWLGGPEGFEERWNYVAGFKPKKVSGKLEPAWES